MTQDNRSRESVQQMIKMLNEEAAASDHSTPQLSLEKAIEAEKLSKDAIFGEAGYLEGEVASLLNQASALYILGESGRGLRVALTALEKARSNFSISLLHSNALKLVASSYTRLGDYPKSVSYYHEMLLVAQQINNIRHVVIAQNGLGIIYARMEEYENAINQFQKCLELAEEPNAIIPRDRLGLNLNICVAYRLLGQFQKGILFGLNALKVLQQHDVDNRLFHITLLNELARSYSDAEQYEEAEQYFEQAHQLVDDAPSKRPVADLYLGYGTFLLKHERLEEAQHLVEDALQLTNEFDGKVILYQCHELLAQIMSKMGDFERAYHHHAQFQAIESELRKEENAERLRLLRISHEVDVAQKETEIYRLRTEKLEELVAERTADVLNALEQSERANIVRSNMIKTIMHEFRTPLTVISSSSSLLKKHSTKMPPEKQEQMHSRITDSIQYLSKLLTEVSKVENSSTGNLEPSFSSVTVGQWSEKLCGYLRRETADPSNVTYIFDAADETTVEIDTEMTKAIALELVTNAIKYTLDDKPITVEMGVDGDDLVITVADEGMGIAADEMDKVYELFYRAYNAGDIPGLGTGLYVVMAMVKALGGEMSAKSDGIGLGTIFSVKLPK